MPHQFEELFTETRDDRERQGFICSLLDATKRADVGVRVVARLRADFIGECLGFSGLDVQLEQSLRFVLPPMKRQQLFDAIVRPAARLGVQIDNAVRDDLLRETVGQTGQLPLLQFALAELWKQREGDRLTYDSYERFEKIRGAIAQTADEVLRRMDPSERPVALRLLRRLVHPGAGTGDTRRMAYSSEIDTSETTRRVLERLTRSRLVTRDDDTFDIAHEVLIQEWSELRRVLNERREALPVEQQLASDCQTWIKSARASSELWSGGRLTRALERRTAKVTRPALPGVR